MKSNIKVRVENISLHRMTDWPYHFRVDEIKMPKLDHVLIVTFKHLPSHWNCSTQYFLQLLLIVFDDTVFQIFLQLFFSHFYSSCFHCTCSFIFGSDIVSNFVKNNTFPLLWIKQIILEKQFILYIKLVHKNRPIFKNLHMQCHDNHLELLPNTGKAAKLPYNIQ